MDTTAPIYEVAWIETQNTFCTTQIYTAPIYEVYQAALALASLLIWEFGEEEKEQRFNCLVAE